VSLADWELDLLWYQTPNTEWLACPCLPFPKNLMDILRWLWYLCVMFGIYYGIMRCFEQVSFGGDRSNKCLFSCRKATILTLVIDELIRHSWRCIAEIVGSSRGYLCRGAKLTKELNCSSVPSTKESSQERRQFTSASKSLTKPRVAQLKSNVHNTWRSYIADGEFTRTLLSYACPSCPRLVARLVLCLSDHISSLQTAVPYSRSSLSVHWT